MKGESSSDLDWLSGLQFSVLTITLQAVTDLLLPPFLGSTFRGVFGTALKRVVCIRDLKDCEHCPLRQSCPYVRLFEPLNPLSWLQTSHVSPPFVLTLPKQRHGSVPAGTYLTFQLVTIGWATEYLPYFVAAWQRAGREMGVGKGRSRGMGRFEISAITDGLASGERLLYEGWRGLLLSSPVVRTAADCSAGKEREIALRTIFRTPVRLQSEGHLLGRHSVEEFGAGKLLEAAYRRLYILAACYGMEDLPPLHLPEFPDDPALYENVRWQEWKRYSNRQRTHMRLGGIVGEMVLGRQYQPWFPLLRACSVLHVGKATSFGFGQIECQGLMRPAHVGGVVRE